jgi:DNA-binding NarL/FixJ family response regulator
MDTEWGAREGSVPVRHDDATAGGHASMVLVAVQQRHRLLREGLQLLLDAEDDVAVVGTATTGDELVELCVQTRPDVVVADVDGLDGDACVVASALRQALPTARLVGLYHHLDVDAARVLRRAGFRLLFPRAEGVAPILNAVRNVPQAVIPLRRAPTAGPPRLTSREVTVLELISAGCTSGDVGRELSISQKTVENHKQRIFRKLGVQNQAHAVSLAMRHGFIGVPRAGRMAG